MSIVIVIRSPSSHVSRYPSGVPASTGRRKIRKWFSLFLVTKPRIAVVGAGSFGRNHLRVIHQSPNAELAGVLDVDDASARQAAETHGCPVFDSLDQLAQHADAAVVATPTVSHADIGCRLMELGVDVLVEKPIAHEPTAARRLVGDAARLHRILQV